MHISLAAEPIGHLFGLPITNSILMTWLSMILLVVFSYFGTHQMKKVPAGLQNFLEIIIEWQHGLIKSVFNSSKQAYKYLPFIATFFIFIVTANWLGLVPGIGTVGFHEIRAGQAVLVPLLRPANSDLNMTLAMATISVIATQIFGIIAIGVFKYSKKYFNFSSPIMFFTGILELVSEISKMISFSFRLFGNIFAGEVLLTVIAFLVPFIAPLPFYGLELFVGLIQALVFMMLTAVFIKVAVTEH